MDHQLSPTQRNDSRDERAFKKDDSFACQSAQSGKEKNNPPTKQEKSEQKKLLNLVGVLEESVFHFFPRFSQWLETIPDPRNPILITYTLPTLIWIVLTLFSAKQAYRKRITDVLSDEEIRKNILELSGQKELKKLAHDSTVAYLFQRLKPLDVESMQVKMVSHLLRQKVFEKYRLLDKYYTVAIDGYHLHTFDEKHCEGCLKRKDRHGNVQWFHYVVEAALVTSDGHTIPMANEWIENEENYEKQDCELRATYRLLEKLRKLYPKLPMCILLDGLYANEPVFKKLKKLRLEGIIVFKKGSMSEVYEWVMNWLNKYGTAEENQLWVRTTTRIKGRGKRTHEERLKRVTKDGKERKVIVETFCRWMSHVAHWDGERFFNVCACKEKKEGKHVCDYVWLATEGITLNKQTIEEVVNRGGRRRWNIEDSINTKKNRGYNAKHPYSKDPNGMKIWFSMMEITHIINQLMEHGSLLPPRMFNSIKELSLRLLDDLKRKVFIKPTNRKRIQIRMGKNFLNSS